MKSLTSIEAATLGRFTVAYVGLVSSVAGLLAFLSPTLPTKVAWQWWALAVLVLSFLLCLMIAEVVALRSPAHHEEEHADEDLYAALPRLLRDALSRSEYREVVRLGDALSRPLFESGEFHIRLELGRLTEEAAAHLGARDIQRRTLIDAIGWSLIELGHFPDALAALKHGLALAEEDGDAFYRAKALRHMGAIERRRGRMDDALDFYERGREASRAISDQTEAEAMEAGITYAVAHLRFSRRDYPEALIASDQAIELFKAIHDPYRVDMALVLKADILIALDQQAAAKDLYRSVLQSSKTNRESVHYIRATLGLAELYVRERRPEEAARLLEGLAAPQVARMPAFKERFQGLSSTLAL